MREGADEEFIAYFPEYAEPFRETLQAWRALCALLDARYAPPAGLDAPAFGRAADALRREDRTLPALLFAMRRGVSAAAALRAARIENVLRMCARRAPRPV